MPAKATRPRDARSILGGGIGVRAAFAKCDVDIERRMMAANSAATEPNNEWNLIFQTVTWPRSLMLWKIQIDEM